jgi:hypothetical protein
LVRIREHWRPSRIDMATKIDFQLIPLERFSAQPFDFSQLPFSIVRDVEVADVSSLLPPSMFEYLRFEVGQNRMHVFDGTTKYALVHRYEEDPRWPGNAEAQTAAKKKAEILNEVFACSRIVRPTRRLGSVSGFLRDDGTVEQRQATFPDSALDVPEALKLFAFRNKDLEELRNLIGTFLKAIHGEYWPLRMAVQYYYMGYEVNDWKGRYLYWGSSAIHALYSSSNEKIVRRIKWFLGDNTLIYPPGEHPEAEFLGADPTTIGEIVEDVNVVRNCIAHGERIPDKYFKQDAGRNTLNGKVNYITVLDDALAFIVRSTLRRIVAENLLGDFASRVSVSQFWKTNGL